MMPTVTCSNPYAQYLAHQDEIDEAIRRVLASGRYILGEEVAAFEREFADYLGVRYAVGVGNGTEALGIAFAACGIGRGDEVMTVSHTAVATVAAIELAGATPVLVDIEPEYFTLDPTRLDEALTARTKAVIPVHLYGQPAELEPIVAWARRHGVRVIEDCAQAHGAAYQGGRVGTFGDAGCFSFYPTKNLGAIGDGGMLVTNDPGVASRACALREYGWEPRGVSAIPGGNSRLDELQAAILRVKLRHLEADNAARVRAAQWYDEALAECEVVRPRVREDATHVYHQYVVRSARRDALKHRLQQEGIEASVHYPVPVHHQPAYRGRLSGSDRLPQTERAAQEVLSLPMYPELTRHDQGRVVDGVRACAPRERLSFTGG